ncbi:unnamed protein product [Ixodes pacificus]
MSLLPQDQGRGRRQWGSTPHYWGGISFRDIIIWKAVIIEWETMAE